MPQHRALVSWETRDQGSSPGGTGDKLICTPTQPHTGLCSPPSSLQPPFRRPARGVLQKRTAEFSETDKGSPFLPTRGQAWTSLPARLPGCASPTVTHALSPALLLPLHRAGLPTAPKAHSGCCAAGDNLLSLLGEAPLGLLIWNNTAAPPPNSLHFSSRTYQHLPVVYFVLFVYYVFHSLECKCLENSLCLMLCCIPTAMHRA